MAGLFLFASCNNSGEKAADGKVKYSDLANDQIKGDVESIEDTPYQVDSTGKAGAMDSCCTGLFEDCANGLDDDGDNLADCLDPSCCADAACLLPPPPLAGLDVVKVAGSTDILVSWAPAPPFRASAAYDVLSGSLIRSPASGDPPMPGVLWRDRGTIAAACVANDLDAPSWRDARPTAVDVLGTYSLVREQAPCGAAGSYGVDSLGIPNIDRFGDSTGRLETL